MPYAKNKDVSLYYEAYGPENGPALIMVEGYTAQMVGWERGFVENLNAAGIRTILMDNRDVGLSSQVAGPDQIGKCYSVADMADDVVAVADACGLKKFHVLGQSMGGMIAQQLLVDHEDRLKSASIFFTAPANQPQWMSESNSSGDSETKGLDAADSRDEAIEIFISRERACHEGSIYGFDEQWARELGGITYDRCYRVDGWRRQQAAMSDFAIDADKLGASTVPSLVIHGRNDPFFNDAATWFIADHLKNSEVHVYPGMAHEIPRPLWGEFTKFIARTVRRGEQ
ncbi:alpha/beta hydrolase [Bifidobacterium sp. ESL0728]|uniref:alpha/beta fold hydrolase n=1 Tax=Bifidobacterium sp. ESL0728 TaxID=2983220 RepID=UPI0023F804B0|nr:alpha/beta hydrolase [Bifidobacterium sp. ESL0728]WEV59271.1 alpha/beta hydrolase [Bifidobacterium sp. ESL0728]